MSDTRKSEFGMIEQPERGSLNEGLSFGYVDVPKVITPDERPFLDQLTANSLQLQKEIRPGHEIPMETRNVIIPTSYGDMNARIYIPEGKKLRPLVMNYHGGGFVIRDIECFDYLSRAYAKEGDAVVITIEYYLGPEYKYPVQAEQAYEALLWARKHAAEFGADAVCDVLTGDSAGGNLSAVVTLMCRDRGEKLPAMIIPSYPVVDARPEVKRESDELYGTGYNLDYQHLLSYNRAYVEKTEQTSDPYVSPLLADLAGFPPTRMICAQCDVLLDSGMEFAEKLREAGVDIDYRIYKGVPHDFLFYGFPESYAAYHQIGQWIRELTAGKEING